MANLFSFLSLPANSIDVLQMLKLSENMEGVTLEAGLCTSRRDTEETDLAYRIKKIQLSAPTKQLFPGNGLFFSYKTLYRVVFQCNIKKETP